MKFGVQLPEVERPVGWPEYRDIALTAEECGFDSIWVGDHLLYRDKAGGTRGPFEAWSTLAALAEATERVELGPLVASTSFHSPAMIAKKAATIDEISGGRLILGLGAGWNEVEYSAFGFPYDRRASRFEEAFTVIRKLVREGSIDFEGQFYTHREMVLVPPARPDLPIMLGSIGPRMLRIAAPHMDMWNTWYIQFGNQPAGLGPLVEDLHVACEDSGRDPNEIEKSAAVYVQLARGAGRIAGHKGRSPAIPVSGTSDEIAMQLHGFASAGMDHLQLVLDPIDAASVEEVGEAVRIARELSA